MTREELPLNTVYIVGHKNPDNDAIMAAVCYAELKNQVDNTRRYQACRLGPLPKESAAVLERFGVDEPMFLEGIAPAEDGVKQQIILVDHNEKSQAVDGLEHAEVIEIIDHHRVADIETSKPILFLNVPIGSTSSLIASRYHHMGVDIPDNIAGCLLSAMMTDMVIMKSPTTTEFDKRLAHELANQIGVDPTEYGKWVFNARGSGDFTPQQMCERDTKLFEVRGRRIYIGQYETVDKAPALEQREAILETMEQYRIEHEGDTFVLLITDILEEGSQLFVVGEPDVVAEGLNITPCPEGVWMPGVLSRKKQVAAPLIEMA